MSLPRIPVTALLGTLALLLAPASLDAQDWKTMSVSRQLQGTPDRLDVHVSYGAGRFELAPAGSGLLYSMRLRYDEETEDPVATFEGGHLRLGVENSDRDIRFGKRDDEGEMSVRLAPDVPMSLEIATGAVEAELDLGGLALTGLDLRTGASKTRLRVSEPNPIRMDRAELQVGAADFRARDLGNLNARRIEVSAGVGDVELDLDGSWEGETALDVSMGLGALTLRVPSGVGVRFERETFLSSVDAEGLERRGDTFYSPNWESASRRVRIKVDAAFGSVGIRWGS